MNNVIISLQELKSVTGGQDGNNWRFLPLTGYQRVPSESMQMLSKPTPFEVSESGKVSSIRLSHDEPEWSINFKKALVALFQTGLGHTSGVSSEGFITQWSKSMRAWEITQLLAKDQSHRLGRKPITRFKT